MAAILDLAAILEKNKFASYSNMKEHTQMHFCAKFHACMIKCTHYPGLWTILLD